MVMTSRPIYYRPIERHWYRVADAVQYRWHPFAISRTGRFIIWLLPRLLRIVFKLAMWLAVAVVVVGCGVLYITLSMCLGGGALNKAVSKAGR